MRVLLFVFKIAFIVLFTSTTFASASYAAKGNIAIPKTVKVGPKGKQRSISSKRLRQSKPQVYRLLKRTTQAAQSYRARGREAVPLTCHVGPGSIFCQHGLWICAVTWGSGGVVATCTELGKGSCGASRELPPCRN